MAECGHTFHCLCLMTNIAHNGFGCLHCQASEAEADTNSLLHDDVLRGFRLFNNLLDGVYHDDDDDDDDDYYNIRCDPDDSAGYNRRTLNHYNDNGYDGYDAYGPDNCVHNRLGGRYPIRLSFAII